MDRAGIYIHHTPTLEQAAKLTHVTEKSIEFDKLINDLLPQGRYRALALTALEECAMWTKRGVISDEPAQ